MDADKSRASHVLDGAVVTTVAALTQGIGQIVLLAVLARYVSQAEFGLVTATLVLIGLGRQFTEALLRPVIIQRQTLTGEDIGTAAFISWLFAFFALVLLMACAPAIGQLFSEPAIVPVIKTLSLVFVIQAPSLVAEGLLYRELKFSRIAFAEVLSFLFGYTLVGVTLALAGLGVRALIWAYLAQVCIKCLVVVWLEPKTLLIRFNYAAFRHILWMSGGFSAAKVLGYIATQIDYLVVASIMSSAAVGVYGRAYQLVGMPTMLFGQVLERVMFPVYSRLQNEQEKAKLYFGYAVSLSSMVMAPLLVLFVVLGPEIVRIILGPDWHETVLPLQILASTMIFRMGYKLNDPLTKATGLVYQRAMRLAIYVVAVAAGAFAGSWWGLAGVAVGVSLAILVNFILMADLTLKWLGASWRWFVAKHVRALVIIIGCFPVLQLSASGLRALEIGYLGVFFGVVTLFVLLAAVVIIAWPSYLFSPDVRWFCRLLARRIEPKAAKTAQSLVNDKGMVVELLGLNANERAMLPNYILRTLHNEGIPGSDILQCLNQRKRHWLFSLCWIRLVLRAFQRLPRASLYQLLSTFGDQSPCSSGHFKNVIIRIGMGELVAKARAVPGIHLFVCDTDLRPFSFTSDLSVDVTQASDDLSSRSQHVIVMAKKTWLLKTEA
ncbi:lipopolysaccharide biosynthesis protein [Vibrio sp. ABG19]|uniref:lipopolysaccharide biosynthesis protein n=1 Tax=Vibrio sp. ABG19 TaxID=2817385 RepID=UPI00249E4BBB|nr:lipopolysaccharide biosynthesis protein [Vibrio sp. ABG19]WGY46811.1 lipopolysaccharide biosynthesis protein [Vibrio sp. ABG19]